MRVLAFDTSTPRVVAGLARRDEPQVDGAQTHVHAQSEMAPNRHGELLAPLIERVLRAEGIDPASLDAVGVGLGPGPFTGLRVGVVTAKTMGDALGIPTYGVCSLDVIARDYRSLDASLVVATDARRKQVYWRQYDATGEPVGPPELSPPLELADRLNGKVGVAVGAGVELYPEAFRGFATTQVVGGDPVGYPDAGTLVEMVGERAFARQPGDDLVPMYLRRPDARPPGRPKQVTPA